MAGSTKILVFTDDLKKAEKSVGYLKRDEWLVKAFSLDDFLTVLPLEGPECVLLYLSKKEKYDELKFILDVHDIDDNIPVIIISEKGRIEDAVSVMRGGAYDYYTDFSNVEKILISISNAVRMYDLTKRVYLLEQRAGWQGKFDNIIGHSAKMQEIFQLVSTVAKSNATVLILGESGTGKELIAKAVHKHSKRAKHPFIDINCGAIPRELLENELFGHERGSYTGADKRYIGSCERANKGTLFLDEICEMDALLQVKLLRLLQERSFNRVGGVEKIQVDLRFIAATNRDIEAEVKSGRFREDLYYRLNVVPVLIPPLRDRRDDILLITNHFLEKFSTKNEKIFVEVADDAVESLMYYDWPGNVRELENAVERIVVLNNDSQLKLKHLPPHIQEAAKNRGARKPAVSPYASSDGQKIIPLELVEKYAIEAALDKCSGSVAEAARQLKIGQATLYRKIKQYGFSAG